MPRRTLKLMATAALAVVLMAAPPASAQWVVIDPANLAQSIAQVTHMIEQIRNQVRQVEQAAAMLQQNPLQLSPELSQSIGEARALLDAAEGLAFEANSIGDDIRTLYPETWENFELDEVLAQSDQWVAQSRASLERAMEAEARAAEAMEGAQSHIDRALQSSSGAEGQTGAIQASNQLLGIQATQLAEIQTLLIAQGRALETERMERLAREERAGEIQRRAFPTQTNTTVAPARSAFEQ
jgi:type IV secretion system protein TrbJ